MHIIHLIGVECMSFSAAAALTLTCRDFDVIGQNGECARKERLPFTCDMSEFYRFLDRLQVRDLDGGKGNSQPNCYGRIFIWNA